MIFNDLIDFMVNVTQNDLLQFLYNELSPEQSAAIEQQLEADSGLQERLAVLKAAKDRLEKITLLSPDSRTVENILNYAEQAIEEFQGNK